GRLNAPIKV
nr:Chain C, GLY-ARG-LEU-ASN-ALA-PRO-ILE-LYS-VAL [synthetic construct]6Y27_C Chain C, mA [synthetic construct]